MNGFDWYLVACGVCIPVTALLWRSALNEYRHRIAKAATEESAKDAQRQVDRQEWIVPPVHGGRF